MRGGGLHSQRQVEGEEYRGRKSSTVVCCFFKKTYEYSREEKFNGWGMFKKACVELRLERFIFLKENEKF